MIAAAGTMGAVFASLWLAGLDDRRRKEESLIVWRVIAVGMVLQLKSPCSTLDTFLNWLKKFRVTNDAELEKRVR